MVEIGIWGENVSDYFFTFLDFNAIFGKQKSIFSGLHL